ARVRVRSRPSNRRTRPILSNQYAQWTIKRRLFGDDYPILAVTTHPSMPAPIKRAMSGVDPPRTATWLTEMAFFPEAAIASKEALERKDAAIIFGRAEKWNKHENGLRTLAWRPSSTCRELLPLVFQTTKPVEVFRGITRDIPAGKRRKRNSDQDYKSSRIQA
uniref:DRMBL domain-containing protein n=1 Tax=Macrostomum lignano TaxID=282301 RepID=A0A1I8JDB4_9PLAT